MRTSILGVLNFNGELKIIIVPYLVLFLLLFPFSQNFANLMPDIPKVVANTAEISKVTHADPRCTASCTAVTTAVSSHLADIFMAYT